MEPVRRPINTRRFSWLTEESRKWVNDSFLTEEMRSRILESYERPEVRQKQSQQYGVMALLSLAMFLLGLAVLLAVGFNWKWISPEVKLVILFSSTTGAYFAAYLFHKFSQEIFSEVMFFLGGILYGICIWQIAQIYNVVTHYPDGVWLWAAGVFLVALTLKTQILHFLVVALLYIWVTMEIMDFHHMGPSFLRNMCPWIPNIAVSLPVFVLIGEWWGRRRGFLTVRLFYVMAFFYWLFLQPMVWETEGCGPFYFIFLGFMLFMIPELSSVFHASGSDRSTDSKGVGVFSGFSQTVGTLCMAGGLIPLSFHEYWDSVLWRKPHLFADYSYAASAFPLENEVLHVICLVCMLGILGCLGAWMLSGNAATKKILKQNWPVLLVSVLCMLTWSLVIVSRVIYGMNSGISLEDLQMGVIWLMKGMMVLFALNFIFRGVYLEHFGVLAFGVCYLILWAILRFAVLFMSSMLYAAGIFAFCALLLIGVCYFWKYRKIYDSENELA
ncbi:MAG: DUF2157 domain-containing protein [Planctomycetia bacterium]|nr:DUF2157 domain-containing protein [Planctomycetia bacterium]